MVADLTYIKAFAKMAEEKLNSFTNNTLIPFSLVTAALTMVVAIVISFISLRKDVDFNSKTIYTQSQEIEKIKSEFIKKNELLLELKNIQLELSNIKEKINK